MGGDFYAGGACEWEVARVPFCCVNSAGALGPIAFRASRWINDRMRFYFTGGWVNGWVGVEAAMSGPCNGGSLRRDKSVMTDLAAPRVGERLGGAKNAVSTPCSVGCLHPLGWMVAFGLVVGVDGGPPECNCVVPTVRAL